MRILVWGCGAIGGTAAAAWHLAGERVTCVDANEEHVRAINARGLRVYGPLGDRTVPLPAFTPETIEGEFDCVVLAVKSDQTERSARLVDPLLSAEGFVVSFQNGLNEIVLAEILGQRRTVGAFVNWSAEFMEPGTLWLGGLGALVVGEIDGIETPRLRELHGLCRRFVPDAAMSDDIMGYLWGKLIYGSFLRVTALADKAIVDGLADPVCRGVCIGLAREILAVADREQVRLHGFNGFDPEAFRPGAALPALDETFQGMIAFNAQSEITHASVWRDLVVRRRPTDTTAQFAPLRGIARRGGVPVPMLDRLVDTFERVEGGQLGIGPPALARLARPV